MGRVYISHHHQRHRQRLVRVWAAWAETISETLHGKSPFRVVTRKTVLPWVKTKNFPSVPDSHRVFAPLPCVSA
jgi:hypothetical protein